MHSAHLAHLAHLPYPAHQAHQSHKTHRRQHRSAAAGWSSLARLSRPPRSPPQLQPQPQPQHSRPTSPVQLPIAKSAMRKFSFRPQRSAGSAGIGGVSAPQQPSDDDDSYDDEEAESEDRELAYAASGCSSEGKNVPTDTGSDCSAGGELVLSLPQFAQFGMGSPSLQPEAASSELRGVDKLQNLAPLGGGNACDDARLVPRHEHPLFKGSNRLSGPQDGCFGDVRKYSPYDYVTPITDAMDRMHRSVGLHRGMFARILMRGRDGASADDAAGAFGALERGRAAAENVGEGSRGGVRGAWPGWECKLCGNRDTDKLERTMGGMVCSCGNVTTIMVSTERDRLGKDADEDLTQRADRPCSRDQPFKGLGSASGMACGKTVDDMRHEDRMKAKDVRKGRAEHARNSTAVGKGSKCTIAQKIASSSADGQCAVSTDGLSDREMVKIDNVMKEVVALRDVLFAEGLSQDLEAQLVNDTWHVFRLSVEHTKRCAVAECKYALCKRPAKTIANACLRASLQLTSATRNDPGSLWSHGAMELHRRMELHPHFQITSSSSHNTVYVTEKMLRASKGLGDWSSCVPCHQTSNAVKKSAADPVLVADAAMAPATPATPTPSSEASTQEEQDLFM